MIRNQKKVAFMASFAFLFAVALSAAANAGDRTIYYNGKVFTSDKTNPWAEGVVVDDKFIVAVGSNAEVLALETATTTKIDLDGKLLMPGFNDAHTHPFDYFAYDQAVRLNVPDFVPGPGPTLTEVQALVDGAAQTTPAGTWLFVVVGTATLEDPAFNRFSFDSVSPNHPVLLASWFGHGTLLNTKGLETAGISLTEDDPIGGFYERLPGTNTLSGVVREYGEHLLRGYFANLMSDAAFIGLYEAFASGAAANGITSLQEYSIGLTQERHLDLVQAANIPIKWRAMCFPLYLDDPCDVPFEMAPERPFITKKAGGIKWVDDGTPIERLSFLRDAYADDPGNFGLPNFDDAQIQTQIDRSKVGPRRRTQLQVHVTGDAITDKILDTMDTTLPDAVWRLRRPRFEHGSLLRSDRFAQASSMGVTVITNPLLFTIVDVFNARYQTPQRQELWPVKSLLDNDIHVAIGSDSLVTPANPFLDLLFATNHPANPTESVSMEDAVIAYTAGSARAEFEDSLKGTIKPGKFADMIVLSQDIFTLANPGLLPATQVLMTIVNGEVVHEVTGSVR